MYLTPCCSLGHRLQVTTPFQLKVTINVRDGINKKIQSHSFCLTIKIAVRKIAQSNGVGWWCVLFNHPGEKWIQLADLGFACTDTYINSYIPVHVGLNDNC